MDAIADAFQPALRDYLHSVAVGASSVASENLNRFPPSATIFLGNEFGF
jgi:hypothetical protein